MPGCLTGFVRSPNQLKESPALWLIIKRYLKWICVRVWGILCTGLVHLGLQMSRVNWASQLEHVNLLESTQLFGST